jgi:hypothetical protein
MMAMMSYGMIVLTTRRFNDLVGLGYEGYPTLLALALYAWHSRHSKGRDARFILYDILVGSKWFKSRVVTNIISILDSLGYLEFKCQTPIWKPLGWRNCPKDWVVTVRGYERLQELLSNINLTLDDMLKQPDPFEVKKLIDGRIRAIYREHWERIRHYMEVVEREGVL